MKLLNREPYYVLFPLGVFSAVLGVSLWFAYQAHLINFYPRSAHANLMFFGFLIAFITGFLTTAVPKMTNTALAGSVEIYVSAFMILVQWYFNLTNQINFSVFLYLGQVLFLAIFIGRRYLASKQIPFEGFVFLPFAFLISLISLFVFISGVNQDLALVYKYSGEAFLLNLVCGLGSRLVPVLSRFKMAINPDVAGQKNKLLKQFIFAAGLNLSFFVDFLGFQIAGYLMRIAFLIFFAIFQFRIFEVPTQKTFLVWGFRASVLSLILSYSFALFNLMYSIPSLHFIYIGGFSLMTLMVGTRVTLVHGGRSLELEQTSKSIVVVILAIMAASILRYFAGVDAYASILTMAGLFFLTAILVWYFKISRSSKF